MHPNFGETAARKFLPKKLSVTLGHADLTAAATTETEAIGTLPAGATVLGVCVSVATAFSGITGPVTVDIGSADDVDALIDGATLSTAVDGMAATRPLGIAPNKTFAAETAIIATVLSASGNLVDCDAGACTIEIFYTPAIGT